MSAPECVYRSTHPDVVAPMKESTDASKAWGVAVDAFLERFPGFTARYSTAFGKLVLVCLHRKTDTDPDVTPGPGWRQLTKGRLRGEWVPDRRNGIGKSLQDEINAMTVSNFAAVPGMPKELHVPGDDMGRFRSHGLRLIDGVVWCTWGLPATVVEESDGGVLAGSALDRTMWERANLSDYYLAVEKHEAELAGA